MIAALRPHLVPFLALLALLALTATCAFAPIGQWNIIVALAIAGTKTGFVVYFFMELRKERTLIHVASGVGLAWLLILLTLALSDFMSRFPGALLE